MLEAPVGEWSLNSLGAMQGGAVATVIDAAAEAAARAATGEELVVTDIQLTYLALARVGPIRTRVEVLGARLGCGHRPRRAGRHGSRLARHEHGPGRRDVIAAR